MLANLLHGYLAFLGDRFGILFNGQLNHLFNIKCFTNHVYKLGPNRHKMPLC